MKFNFNRAIETFTRKENKRSILESREYIESLETNFYEIYNSLAEKLQSWKEGEDKSQRFLNEFEYDFKKLRDICEIIEVDFKGTKEGEEYYTMEKQQENKKDFFIAVEMGETLYNTPVQNLPKMKRLLNEMEKIAISRFEKPKNNID